MIEVIVLCVLGLIWVVFASMQDLKEREVANWLNFSLIVFALGFRFFYSLFVDSSFDFFYQGIIWLVIFFAFGNFLYYARFFAGGDAKMFIALGTIIPFSSEFMRNLDYSLVFFFIFLFVGALYGLIFSFYYAYANWSSCKKEFEKQYVKNRRILIFMVLTGIIFLCLAFLNLIFLYLALMFFIFPYLYFYAKSIDEVCMVKNLDVKKLREGDWLYNDIKIGRKVIEAKWDGVTKKEIKMIQKSKLRKVKIRSGIAFIPVFLISLIIFIILYFTKNIALLFLF